MKQPQHSRYLPKPAINRLLALLRKLLKPPLLNKLQQHHKHHPQKAGRLGRQHWRDQNTLLRPPHTRYTQLQQTPKASFKFRVFLLCTSLPLVFVNFICQRFSLALRSKITEKGKTILNFQNNLYSFYFRIFRLQQLLFKKWTLKDQSKSKSLQWSTAVRKFHAFERSEVPRIRKFSAYEIFWIYSTLKSAN